MGSEVKRIVVMGGSFNPPTVAHHILMQKTIDAIGADKGIFVPVSDAYLRRKMRGCHPPVVLSPEMRIKMLAAMCTDPKMMVCDKEIGTIEARTVPTLIELQADYPDAEIYFLMGSDKLDLLKHLSEKHGFLDMFKVALYSRDKDGLEEMLRENETLSESLDRIEILPQPEGTDHISSSIIRERLLAGESCVDMLCPGVWELLKPFRPEDFHDMIYKFQGEYEFLSNRFVCEFIWEGLRYTNAEAAFQSSKCANPQDRDLFGGLSAKKAMAKGSKITPPEGWEERQTEIMKAVLLAKFSQNPDLMNKLLATGESLLVNGNSQRELFWGVDTYSWRGENNLGKILMEIRNQINNK